MANLKADMANLRTTNLFLQPLNILHRPNLYPELEPKLIKKRSKWKKIKLCRYVIKLGGPR